MGLFFNISAKANFCKYEYDNNRWEAYYFLTHKNTSCNRDSYWAGNASSVSPDEYVFGVLYSGNLNNSSTLQ